MIADILPRYQVTSDGSTVAYTVPFELIESNLINVYVDSEKQSSGYSVNVSAKTITFDNAPDEGKLITIIRAIPISWEVSDFGSLNEKSLDRALTLLIAKMQTLEEEINRSPKTNPYDKETGSDLSELFFTEMRDALDSLEQAKVVYAQIQASGTQALADITTEKNSAISDINDNSSDRIGEFNTNATNKTAAFNTNANTVTDTFNQNATDKTNDFNTNAAQKQAAVDASAAAAATSATNAATSEANAATSEANAASTEARINETLSTYVTYVGDPTGEVTLKNKDDQTLIPYTELATANKAGRVKPDGTTTSVDSNGAMSVVGKQDTLVSGTNIKTVNGNSLLGSGDVTIGAQVSWGNITGTLSNQTDLKSALDAKANDSDVVKLTGNQTASGQKTFINTIKSNSILALESKTNQTTFEKPTQAPTEIKTIGRINFAASDSDFSMGYIRTYRDKSNTVATEISARQSIDGVQKTCILGVKVDKDGNTFTSVPTPATSDSSSKIATTENVDAKITAQAVKLTGNQTIGGAKTFTSDLTLQGASVQPIFKATGYTKGTAPTTDTYMCHRSYKDNNNNNVFHEFYYIPKNTNRPSYILRFQDVSSASASSSKYKDIIIANYDGTNANYAINATTATAPTPSTTDNSTKIATTAFFRNNMQVVDALPANPVEGVFYYIPDNSLPQQMTNYDYVVDYKTPTDADPTWYRVYKSGWVEQGGILPKKNNWSAVTITFPKPFVNTLYTVLTSTGYTANTDASTITGKTTTNFTTTGYNSTGFAGWQASGQGV